MKICIAGWYYDPLFLKSIKNSKYEAFIIKHRDGNTGGIMGWDYPNKGLEFGAYQQYISEQWDGVSDVLFCHDDISISNINSLDYIANLAYTNIDHAYIFNNIYEEYVNKGCHGRGMWARGTWIKQLKDSGGFPVDWDNAGDILTHNANKGIHSFHAMLKGSTVGVSAIVPGIEFARRGFIPEQIYVYKRCNDMLITPIQESNE